MGKLLCCFGARPELDDHLSSSYVDSQEKQAAFLRGEKIEYAKVNRQRPNMPVPQQLSPKQRRPQDEKQLQKEKAAAERRRAASQDSDVKLEEMLRPSSYYSIFQKIKPSTLFRKKQERLPSVDSDRSRKGSFSSIFSLIKPSEDYRRRQKEPGTPKPGPSSEYMSEIGKRPESGASIFRPSSQYLQKHKNLDDDDDDDDDDDELDGESSGIESQATKSRKLFPPTPQQSPRTRNIYRVLGPRKPRKKANGDTEQTAKKQIRVVRTGFDDDSVTV